MASITGVFSNGSKNVIPWIDYTYTQNKDTLSTTITAKLYVKRATSYGQSYSSNCAVKLTIGGTVVVNKSPIKIDVRKLSVGSSVLVAEGSRTIKHDSNGNLSASIAGYVDMSQTSLGTANFSQTITFPTIIVNTPPTMSGSLSVSPSGTIAENTGTINLSWTKATDAQGNANKYVLERFINGRYDKSYEINNINTVSYTDNISAFVEGTSIYYQIFAYDTFGAISNGLQSAVITKNTLTGATLASNSSISSSFASIPFTWSGAKNTFTGTNATAFDYTLTADGITIYNNTTTGTSMSVSIVDGTASGPYIKKADLINKFKSSNFNGSLTFTLKTANKFGSSKTTSKAISVDLRATPTAATPVISEDATLSTALKTVSSTGNKYFIPNGTDKIRITWSGASDVLGQALSYDVYVKIGDGGFEEKKTNLTVGYYDLVLPKQSASQQIVARVITKTSYGYSKEKDSTARTLHYYNAPSVDVLEIDRTDETATATIKLKPNTSIPNINFPTRSYSGVSSGTLSNTTNNQNIVATGLKGENTYSWTITLNDDTGFTSVNQIKEINIPAYTPLFSVREKGVGVNAIPDGSAGLIVNGGTKITGGLTVDGKRITGDIDTSNLLKKSDLATATNYKGKVANIGDNGVMEVGKYIDFHNHTTNDYDSRITCDGDILTISRHLATGGNLTVGGTINPQSYIQLPNTGGSWIDGSFKGSLRGYRQSTGSYHPIITQTTSSGHKVSLGGLGDNFGFYLYDANRTANGFDKEFTFSLADKQLYTTCRTIHNEWIYCQGDYGLFFQTHNGGWYMSDSSWLRSYADKNIYTGGRIKAGTALETRYIDSTDSNLDINARGNTLFINANAASGANLNINREWSGSQGTEISIFNNKGKGWGYLGNSSYSFYRVYGAGGSVSARESKYEILKADTETQYDNVKALNIYNYRSISDERDEEGNVVKEYKREDLMLGCMVDELPLETTFYDNEDGNGKAVDMYSYTTMILGATKHLIEKVEVLEKENEVLKNKLYEMEELLNGIINKE